HRREKDCADHILRGAVVSSARPTGSECCPSSECCKSESRPSVFASGRRAKSRGRTRFHSLGGGQGSFFSRCLVATRPEVPYRELNGSIDDRLRRSGERATVP